MRRRKSFAHLQPTTFDCYQKSLEVLVRNPVSHIVATMASSMLTSFVGSTMAFTVAKVSGKGTVSNAEAHMRLPLLMHVPAGPCLAPAEAGIKVRHDIQC